MRRIGSVKKRLGAAWWLDRRLALRLDALAKRHSKFEPRPRVVFAAEHIGNAVAVFGWYDRLGLELLFDALSPVLDDISGGIALDVGANIGNHSLWFSTRFRRVLAFEPNPTTFRLLEMNVEGIENVTARRVGLGRHPGSAFLVSSPLNMGSSALRASPVDRALSHEVRIERLDDVVGADLGAVTFVKLDVEGFEKEVLAGCPELLSKTQPVIALEQNRSDFDGRGESEVLSLLASHGYRFCWYEPRPKSWPRWMQRLYAAASWLPGAGYAYDLVHAPTVPPGTYRTIVAVPPRWHDRFGIA